MDELVSIVQACTRLAFSELFGNKEHFYYCVLLVTGEGYAPTISAWSWEALNRECAKQAAEHLRGELMWSYADSPYYAFGKEFFLPVQHHLSLRPSIDELSDEEWDKEWQDRMLAYERAMKNLDEEFFWGQGETRKQVYINVESMPIEEADISRAIRLNPSSEILKDWLSDMQ